MKGRERVSGDLESGEGALIPKIRWVVILVSPYARYIQVEGSWIQAMRQTYSLNQLCYDIRESSTCLNCPYLDIESGNISGP